MYISSEYYGSKLNVKDLIKFFSFIVFENFFKNIF